MDLVDIYIYIYIYIYVCVCVCVCVKLQLGLNPVAVVQQYNRQEQQYNRQATIQQTNIGLSVVDWLGIGTGGELL
jgi:hypothetical protein